jgi:hypothetical protein
MRPEIKERCTKFAELKAKHEELKTQLTEIGDEWDEVEKALISDMTEEEVKSVKLEGLGQFTMKVTNRLSVNAANKPKFWEYLIASGNGGLLKLDVNTKTLEAFLKTHLADIKKIFMSEDGFAEADVKIFTEAAFPSALLEGDYSKEDKEKFIAEACNFKMWLEELKNLDEIDAEEQAVKLLNYMGANYFRKLEIAHSAGKK